jgi:hypothetical protein
VDPENESPAGALEEEKLYDPVPPVAARLAEYGAEISAGGKVDVVIPSTPNVAVTLAFIGGEAESETVIVKL